MLKHDEDNINQEINNEIKAKIAKIVRNEDCPTVRQALMSEEKNKWITAINHEKNSLFTSYTIKAINKEDIPENATFIYTTTQLKLKSLV